MVARLGKFSAVVNADKLFSQFVRKLVASHGNSCSLVCMPNTNPASSLAARLERIDANLGAACARLDAALARSDRDANSLLISTARPTCQRCINGFAHLSKGEREDGCCGACDGTEVAFTCRECSKVHAGVVAYFVTDDGEPCCRACAWPLVERVLDAARVVESAREEVAVTR